MVVLNKKKKWFTLVEALVVCSLFATMVLWIVLGINRAYMFLDNTRLSVRASNLAREWVEIVYNIRDSNWMQSPSEKDKMRLYLGWSQDHLFWPWIYVFEEGTGWNDLYNYVDKLGIYDSIINADDEETFYSVEGFFSGAYETAKNRAKITFNWTYDYLSWTEILTWNIEDLLWSWTIDFYRVVRVYGIYQKDNDNPDVEIVSDKNKQGWIPAEMRFCVKVFYDSLWKHNARELCSNMTNFGK